MNWYQNEVDEEIKGADSRDKVTQNEKKSELFLERMMKVNVLCFVCVVLFASL